MPYGQILVGGKRATVESISPEARKELERINGLPRDQRRETVLRVWRSKSSRG